MSKLDYLKKYTLTNQVVKKGIKTKGVHSDSTLFVDEADMPPAPVEKHKRKKFMTVDFSGFKMNAAVDDDSDEDEDDDPAMVCDTGGEDLVCEYLQEKKKKKEKKKLHNEEMWRKLHPKKKRCENKNNETDVVMHNFDSSANKESDQNTRDAFVTPTDEHTNDTSRSGLLSREDYRRETEEMKEKERRETEAAELEQPNVEDVVYRDKEGKHITREEWMDIHKKQKRTKISDLEVPVLEWGSGLVQKSLHTEKVETERKIMAGPVMSYEYNEDQDKELREQHRWEDPMRGMLSGDAENEIHGTENKEETEKELSVEERVKKLPPCKFTGPPNRFGISPGYRWDGKLRGNGFEEKYLQKSSAPTEA